MVTSFFILTGLIGLLAILAVVLPSTPSYDHEEMRQRLRQAQLDLENLTLD
jgi:hypothetical protein